MEIKAGRPKRIADPDLTERLQARRIAKGISVADMAQSLGVAASTLTRSLNSGSFSSDLGNIARETLKDPNAFSVKRKVAVDIESAPHKLSAKDVQILHKLIRILPTAEVILKDLVRRPARRNKA